MGNRNKTKSDHQIENKGLFAVTNGDGQKQNPEIFTNGCLSQSILDQAMEGIVVCDVHGRIMSASKAAHALCGGDPLSKVFEKVFPLQMKNGEKDYTDRTQVETATGPVRNNDGCIYRYEPLTHGFERYVPYGFANPHGRVFDYWGNDIITDATGNENYFGPAFSGFLEYPAKHPDMQRFWKQPSRPCPGTAILSSRHFPEEFQGNFLNLNVIGFLGVFRAKVTEEGSGLKGETIEDLIKSSDPNFRPTGAGVAPDGSVYVLDWSQQLIGHMQHHIRDPNRDHQHGRIYRITYEGRPLLTPAKIDGEPIEKLLDLLKEPEDDVRTRAKIELGKHDSAKVIAAVKRRTTKLDPKEKDYEHHMTEALWVHQWHNVVDQALLKRMLRSPDHRARAAATRLRQCLLDLFPPRLAGTHRAETGGRPGLRGGG